MKRMPPPHRISSHHRARLSSKSGSTLSTHRTSITRTRATYRVSDSLVLKMFLQAKESTRHKNSISRYLQPLPNSTITISRCQPHSWARKLPDKCPGRFQSRVLTPTITTTMEGVGHLETIRRAWMSKPLRQGMIKLEEEAWTTLPIRAMSALHLMLSSHNPVYLIRR